MIWLRAKQVLEARRPLLEGRVSSFRQQFGRPPGLAVILVGDDPASQVYVRGKMKACSDMGLHHEEVRLPGDSTEAQIQKAVEKLNKSNDVDAYLIQLPLPSGLDSQGLLRLVSPEKDGDGLTPLNLGRLFVGNSLVNPCTPQGVMDLLDHYEIEVEGKHAVVVGRSQIVGKPMGHLLLARNATVTWAHSKTLSLRDFTRSADIVVVAAGRPGLLGREDFKPGAVVVDVGIHRVESPEGKSSLCGDVRTEELVDYASALTPVPGGVGPMTIQRLLENAVTLAEHQMGMVSTK